MAMMTKTEVLDALHDLQTQEQRIYDETDSNDERIYRAGRRDMAIMAIGFVERLRHEEF